MIVHQSELSYRENYAEFFKALVKAKEHLENFQFLLKLTV